MYVALNDGSVDEKRLGAERGLYYVLGVLACLQIRLDFYTFKPGVVTR